MANNYVWSLPFLPIQIESIVEIGSRDALDAIFLSKFFDCEVIAFEPAPSNIDVCRENIRSSGRSSIELRTEALSKDSEEIEFFQVDSKLYDNPGASGMFLIDFSNRSKSDLDKNHPPIQSPVKVKAVRWDSLGLPSPELLVMDCEGAELAALKGFGKALQEVKYIVLEVSQVPIGDGACTFKQIEKFLRDNKFKFVASTISRQPLKLKSILFLSSLKRRVEKPWGKRLRGRSFDVVYRNARF